MFPTGHGGELDTPVGNWPFPAASRERPRRELTPVAQAGYPQVGVGSLASDGVGWWSVWVDTPDIRPTSAFLREGWSRQELSRAVEQELVTRVRRGIYSPVADLDQEQTHARQAAAAAHRWHDDFVVSHVSAAVFHGIPVRRQALELVHLSGEGHTHGKVTAGVRIHQCAVPDDQTTVLGGVRVTSFERTLADLARAEPFEWGVIAGDAVLRRSGDRLALAELADLGRRKRGNRRFREVLTFADPRAESPLESLSRVSMSRARIPVPILQMEVVNQDGEWLATSDFGWREFGVVGEADGRAKSSRAEADGKDAGEIVADVQARDRLILGAGWTPTHWGWDLAANHHALGNHLRSVFRTAA